VLPPSVGFSGPDYLKGLLTIDGATLTAGREYPMVVEMAYRGANPSFVPYVFTLLSLSPRNWADKPHFIGAPLSTNLATGMQALDAAGSLPLLRGFAGFEMFVTLRARTLRRGARMLKIRSYSLVEGSYLSNEAAEGVAGNHTWQVDWRWTPGAGQVGRHYACVEALDDGTGPPLSSGQHCFAMDIAPDPPPPTLLSPEPEVQVECYMGSRVSLQVTPPRTAALPRLCAHKVPHAGGKPGAEHGPGLGRHGWKGC
jgi:hypothetical protein